MAKKSVVTAAVVIIGNEVLSGRTQDANLKYLGTSLNAVGIRIIETRIIPDVEDTIIVTVNHLRKCFDYVFTTGGIGPTHDDITSAAVAKAFNVELIRHPEAERLVRSNYSDPDRITPERLKMAEVPEGAELLENPISKSPGFRMRNVYVLPGVPRIMQAMFELMKHGLLGGEPLRSCEISVFLAEGDIGGPLGEIQQQFPDVDLGSYPFVRDGRFGTALVIRHSNQALVDIVAGEVVNMVTNFGENPIVD